jgi:hypothetical protein
LGSGGARDSERLG